PRTPRRCGGWRARRTSLQAALPGRGKRKSKEIQLLAASPFARGIPSCITAWNGRSQFLEQPEARHGRALAGRPARADSRINPMSISRRRRNFIAAIVLPFLAQAAWLLVYHELQGVAGDAVGPFLYLAPAMAGF